MYKTETKKVTVIDVEMEHRKLNVDKCLEKNTIPEFFAGKCILITGFTGFMGKYLLMTLLSTCPDVGNIYLVIRGSRNKSVQQKFEKAISNPIFDHIRLNTPSFLNKLKIINGDLTKIGLGISENDRREIIENVSIVYHVAATVRFDIPLQKSILLNVRGARELCFLILELKNPVGVLHVSTGYCQIDKKIIEEKVYKPTTNWKHAIVIAENSNEFELNIICAKYMEGFPNTYTFTKSLAEAVVNDLCFGKLPTIIFRPTIVLSAAEGPIPGWTDNFNGPVGLFIGAGKGLIRSQHISDNSQYDFIPVDFAIKAMLKIIWLEQYLKSNELSVYNCSSFGSVLNTPKTLTEHGLRTAEKVVFDPVWYPSMYLTESAFIHYIHSMLFQVVPSVFFDVILRAAGHKPILLKIQRKVFLIEQCLSHFLKNSWDFYNHKFCELDDHLLPSDYETFSVEWEFDEQHFFDEAARVAQVLLLKEDPDKRDWYEKKKFWLKCANVFLKYSFLTLLGLVASNAALSAGDYISDYIDSL